MDLSGILGTALVGFVIGTLLYGISLLQTYDYFSKYTADRWSEKLAVFVMCILDLLHLVFSVHMVYYYLLQHFGDTTALTEAIWSVKALGIVQVMAVWLVQGLYLQKIWSLASGLVLDQLLSRLILVGTAFFGLLAVAIGIVFMINLARLQSTVIPADLAWVIYAGFSVSAFIDIAISAAMVYLLRHGRSGLKKTDNVVGSLVRHFVSSGMLTSIAAVVYIILYAAKPAGLLYLGMEFVITRLYVNSFLALCNSRKHLNDRLLEDVSEGGLSTAFNVNTIGSGSLKPDVSANTDIEGLRRNSRRTPSDRHQATGSVLVFGRSSGTLHDENLDREVDMDVLGRNAGNERRRSSTSHTAPSLRKASEELRDSMEDEKIEV